MRHLLIFIMALWMGSWLQPVLAEDSPYLLGPGDVIKVSVHNNPDLALETRVPEGGAISFPLIGDVTVGGLTTGAAEKKIAAMLESGGFVKKPQVNIIVSQFQSKMVSVLGSVYKPGRYPLDRATNLADLMALVGGATPDGSDLVTIVSKSSKTEYDLRSIVGKGDSTQNVPLAGGEIVYVHSRDVAVLGQVGRPGKYAVTGNVRTLADFLSVAGGITQNGSDTVVVNSMRDGKVQHLEINVDKVFRNGNDAANIELSSGDVVYVSRAPLVYIYGEVQRPGAFRVESDMTVIQALAQGGGPTPRGTHRGIQLHRRNADGVIEKLTPALTDKVQPEDVIYVPESLF
jgi:polysaccharide biosynthesis/export protein